MATDISWYKHWTKEYNDLCKSRFSDIREMMAIKFKNADEYILEEYMKPTLQTYIDIDMRMNYLHDFVMKNYDKDKDKFHEISGRYSHEFNRYHIIIKSLIKGLNAKLKNKTMKSACEFLQIEASQHLMSMCAFYIFKYESMLREFGFLAERLVV